MAWYPGAERHNIPPGPTDPPIHPRIICVHTMAGSIEGADRRFRDGSGVEAHFGNPMDDRPIWQWRDTLYQADAQAAGNGYCLSVEHEDGGDPSRPLTPAQIRKDLDLFAWLGQEHTIPMRLVQATSEWGIGWHRQFPEWNPHNHSCPGDVRLAQLRTELLPALQGDDVSVADVIAALKDPDGIRALRKALWGGAGDEIPSVAGTLNAAQTVEVAANGVRTLANRLNEVGGEVHQAKTTLDAGIVLQLAPDQLHALAEALAPLVAAKLEIAGHPAMVGTVQLAAEAPPT